jgi:hypothetical protein
MKYIKRVFATAIVWIGCAAAAVFGMVFIWALVSAFIADWPVSFYTLLSMPFLMAAIVGAVLLGRWAWENKWKP